MNAIIILFVILLVIGVGVGATIYLLRQQQQRQVQAEETRCRSLLAQALKKQGVRHFNFRQFVQQNDIPGDMAERVADETYARFWRKIVEDGQVTDREREQEAALRAALAISEERAADISRKAREGRYHDATAAALADGTITEAESIELQKLRRSLGLGSQQALQATGDLARDHYLALFREIASDGRITPEELQALDRSQKALGLSVETANGLIREDALNLYRQWFTNIVQDGEVTREEEEALQWLVRQFGLKFGDLESYTRELDQVKRLSAYRKGDLPTIQTSKLLDSGTLCHWQGRCCFQWETARDVKAADGELLLTSEQIVFSSPVKSFNFSPSRVVDVRLYSNAVNISTSINRGAGTYFVEVPSTVEAILIGLAKRHKYILSENYSSAQSRHIPDEVRREVWQRDQGRCVLCGAMDYLEFDHIIPFSKGGANTVKNVRLLCRRCNNLKRDRI